MEFTVVQSDIATQSADALVNAAGTSLRMGSGVAGALRRGAGDPINEEAVSKGPSTSSASPLASTSRRAPASSARRFATTSR